MVAAGVIGALIDDVVIEYLDQQIEMIAPFTCQHTQPLPGAFTEAPQVGQIGAPVFTVAVKVYLPTDGMDVEKITMGGRVAAKRGRKDLFAVVQYGSNRLGRTQQHGLLGVAQEVFCLLDVAVSRPGDGQQGERDQKQLEADTVAEFPGHNGSDAQLTQR